jgi:hypothetical protein
LVFVIKVGCVFCEVQAEAEAEKTVQHQASVMTDCKTVARCGENFQFPVQMPNVFLEGIYKFNVQGEEHSDDPRSVMLCGNFLSCLNKLCVFLLGFFHVWRKKYAACFCLLPMWSTCEILGCGSIPLGVLSDGTVLSDGG